MGISNSLIVPMIGILGIITGVVLGWIKEWISQQILKRKYRTIICFELEELKKELEVRIKDYKQLESNATNVSGERKQDVSAQMNPENFLLRWNYRHKYVFLRNNFEKISFLNENTVKSIIKVYSSLEELEEWRQNAVHSKELYNKIATNPALIARDNFFAACDEIPKTLDYLHDEKGIFDYFGSSPNLGFMIR
jgi:hypothetical protein